MNKGRKYLYWLVSGGILISVVVLLLELGLLLFFPKTTLYPGWKYSSKYGTLLYENETMVHRSPGKVELRYGVNEYGYRGDPIPISESYEIPNIVILGDSYSFGIGVNNGEEYPAIIDKKLDGKFNVINLGVGGWGLTQQIRRFYEFGIQYKPRIVILQFFYNDPHDNLSNRVTKIEEGKFKFQDSTNKINWIKKYISHTFIQKSQIYSAFHQKLFEFFIPLVSKTQKETFAEQSKTSCIPVEVKFHNDLLELFAEDLSNRRIKLYFFTVVTTESHSISFIEGKVNELDEKKNLEYIATESWFITPEDMETSPVGHYGPRWNYILGSNIADYIEAHYKPN